MIDFIERLREEHNRKKGIAKFQDGGDKDTQDGNFLTDVWNKAGTFLDNLRDKNFEEGQPTPTSDNLNIGTGYERPKTSNADGTFAGSNTPTGAIEFNPTKIVQGTLTNLNGLNLETATGQKTQGEQAALDYTTKNTGTVYKTESLAENNKATNSVTNNQQIPSTKKAGIEDFFKFFTPGDLESNLYAFGRTLGFKPSNSKQAVAKGVSAVGYGLSSALAGARAVTSGMGNAVANNYVNQYNLDQETQRRYDNASQTMNTNNRGGINAKDGGRIKFFQEGGEAEPAEEQVAAMEQNENQQQSPEVPQRILDIASQLVENFENLESIDQYLQKNRVDEASYNMIMEAAQDIIEANQEEEDLNEEESSAEEEGDIKEGDYVEFEHGGKIHKGRVSKIVNGKIYL